MSEGEGSPNRAASDSISVPKPTDRNTLLSSFCSAVSMILQNFRRVVWHHLIDTGHKRLRPGKLSPDEMLFIIVLFHVSSFKNFKTFCHFGVNHKCDDYSRNLPSYDHFVTLMPGLVLPLCAVLQYFSALAVKNRHPFFWPSKFAVCHNKRICRSKFFNGIAKGGHSAMGWLFCFKLHMVINNQGELMKSDFSLVRVCNNFSWRMKVRIPY